MNKLRVPLACIIAVLAFAASADAAANKTSCCAVFVGKAKEPVANACGFCHDLEKYEFKCRDHVEEDGHLDKNKKDCISFHYKTEASCKASYTGFGGSWLATTCNADPPGTATDHDHDHHGHSHSTPSPVASGASSPSFITVTFFAAVLAAVMLMC